MQVAAYGSNEPNLTIAAKRLSVAFGCEVSVLSDSKKPNNLPLSVFLLLARLWSKRFLLLVFLHAPSFASSMKAHYEKRNKL